MAKVTKSGKVLRPADEEAGTPFGARLRALRLTLQTNHKRGKPVPAAAMDRVLGSPNTRHIWQRLEQTGEASNPAQMQMVLLAIHNLAWATLHRLRRLRVPVKTPHQFAAEFLSLEQVDRLVDAVRTTPRSVLRVRPHREAFIRDRTEFVVRAAVPSGLRGGELARLRKQDVDLDRAQIHVRWLEDQLGQLGRIKTRRERKVPVCAPLRALLEARMQSVRGDFLIHADVDDEGPPHLEMLRQDLARVRQSAGLPWVTFHTLRHTRASWWVQAGVPIAKVAHWLGHTLQVCIKHYAGLADVYDVECERMPQESKPPLRLVTSA